MHVHYLREYSIFVIRRKIKYFQRFSVIKSLDNVSNRYQTLSWCSSVIDQRNSWILQFSWILEFLLLPKISDSAIPRIFFSAILQNHSSNEICDQNRIHQCFYCMKSREEPKAELLFFVRFLFNFLFAFVYEKLDKRNKWKIWRTKWNLRPKFEITEILVWSGIEDLKWPKMHGISAA